MVTQEYPEINWNKIIDRWGELEKYLDANEAPPMDFKWKSKFPCSWCLYKGLCFEDKLKEKPLPARYDMGQNEEA